jgi:FAD/FMN-containing dehydrogenase
MTPPDADTINKLKDQLDGRLIEPGHPDYDSARTLFLGGFDRRPAAIARPKDASEVASVVSIARDAGSELSVRSGGHSAGGFSVIDDGIVIDLTEMRGIEIDTGERTAWAQTGMTAGEYANAAGEHELATGFGDAGTVGIGGITLGGGVGFLSRWKGLTIDDLLAAEIVTADGEVVVADADNHPDLFWALRGGGGNFGVATRFKFRLHELPQVVGGMLMLPASPELVEEFVALADAAPEELSTIANVMPAPPMPFVPEDQHGKLVVMALVCYAGSAEDGETTLAPFRALATPIADMAAPITYPEIYGPEPEDYHPTAVSHNMFLDRVDGDTAGTIVDYLESSDASNRVVQLRALGGAISRVPADATAYAHRDSKVMANVVSFYDGEDDLPKRAAWVEELAGKLRQSDEGAYCNFVGDEGPERVAAAYPGETMERLAKVKAEYDPDNFFHNNQNIKPA